METKLSKHSAEATPAVMPRERLSAPVDVYENGEEFLIRADLPGVRPQDVEVVFEKNQLTLRGPFSMPQEEGPAAALEWVRSFTLPGGVDGARISAEAHHGVLTLRLPKQESLKPRQITVKAG